MFQSGKYPLIDLSVYLEDGIKADEDCQMIADLLHEYGFVCVRDPRVDQRFNEEYIEMLEKYYEQTDQIKEKDIRKEVFYQVGLTPPHIERARNQCQLIDQLNRSDKPLTICPPGFISYFSSKSLFNHFCVDLDNKSRFFWRIGDIPDETDYPQLHADAVIPENFPQWKHVMDNWGNLLLETAITISEMCACGFNLPIDTFRSRMKSGPHLLAPTGSDLHRFGELGTVLAGFHSDINFLTVHGRSRYSGLFIWTRQGKRATVDIPHGCLLLQAGKQFEYLTGGQVLAGFHEVIVSEQTIKNIEQAKQTGQSLWRVSSTMFTHIASDQILQPLKSFENPQTMGKYPPMKAGTQILAELAAVNIINQSK